MKSLWFKQCFVSPILAGEKCDTIRKLSNRLPQVGEIVNFTVGPRPPFAKAKIISIKPALEISSARRNQLSACYQETDQEMVQIDFETISC